MLTVMTQSTSIGRITRYYLLLYKSETSYMFNQQYTNR